MEIKNYWLATQRKPLEEVVPHAVVRWLLRLIYKYYGFAARDYDGHSYASIEYRGVFDTEAAARWAANCPGGAVKPIPFNAALPECTVSYGSSDAPHSEASQMYRKGLLLPFVAIPRAELENLHKLERMIDKTFLCANGKCERRQPV